MNKVLILSLFLIILWSPIIYSETTYTYPLSVSCGDITSNEILIWLRGNYPSKAIVEYSYNKLFSTPKRLEELTLIEDYDFMGKVLITGLKPSTQVFYRVYFSDLKNTSIIEGPIYGSCKTAPNDTKKNIRFLWGSDTAGQSFGINKGWGGMKIFKSMLLRSPDFFINTGDNIYADIPIQSTIRLDENRVWNNIITEEKSHIAQTLADFRGNYRYNLLDDNYRRFIASTAVLSTWDDHETLNNWYPGEILDDERYANKNVDILSAYARKAFFEYTPIRQDPSAPDKIYRSFNYGPLLDIFILDLRSHRGPNTETTQTSPNEMSKILGGNQLEWLKNGLRNSKAQWKVIVSSQPIGLIIEDGRGSYDGIANYDGKPLGRELEIANLLAFLSQNNVKNIVFLTGDVHYAAAIYYSPEKAQFKTFNPFYEFISGPLNAGTFGPNKLDNTFGPSVLFQKTPNKNKSNLSPFNGLQFFGEVEINKNGAFTVFLRDIMNRIIYKQELNAK
jgi:alkaline phosphatase D